MKYSDEAGLPTRTIIEYLSLFIILKIRMIERLLTSTLKHNFRDFKMELEPCYLLIYCLPRLDARFVYSLH